MATCVAMPRSRVRSGKYQARAVLRDPVHCIVRSERKKQRRIEFRRHYPGPLQSGPDSCQTHMSIMAAH